MTVAPPVTGVLVVGGGPTGLAAALALRQTGARVSLAAPPHRPAQQSGGAANDRRTAALFGGSIEFLKNLRVWDSLVAVSEPIVAIRIIDDTGRLMRAPEVTFHARDLGLDAFGHNIPNAALTGALLAAARQPASGVTVIETAGVASLDCGEAFATATLREGPAVHAHLIAAADGRSSLCRAAAGIATKSWDYPQSAMVCSFEHSRPHHGISTEFHRPAGPFTVVPMAGQSSSLVWVETPFEAHRLASLDEAAMTAAIEERLQGLLGCVRGLSPRAAFPLTGLTADTFGLARVALIGEAGHVLPPIGAQGLNLGLRDAATLADCVASCLRAGADIGDGKALRAYGEARKSDVTSRIWTIDLLNRSLISDFLPIHLARGAGLYALQSFAPLRRMLLREGIQPSNATPALMKPAVRLSGHNS